jgi:hypothetical protein
MESGRMQLMPGLVHAENLPTPMGRVDIETIDGSRCLTGRWRDAAPRVEVIEAPTD